MGVVQGPDGLTLDRGMIMHDASGTLIGQTILHHDDHSDRLNDATDVASIDTRPTEPPQARTARRVGLHRLQVFLSPMQGVPEDLYLGAGSRFRQGRRGSLHLSPGGRLEGDTYFNAFFLDFWRFRAGIRRVGVTCRANGALRLRLIGHLAGGRTRRLAVWDHPGEVEVSLRWVWDEAVAKDVVRLSLSVEALSEARVAEIAFVSDRAPAREVRVAVGIVTHDREALFEPTVRALSELAAVMPDLVRVHVVNHGPAFRADTLRDLLDRPLFHVVSQPNLGGCGGFARVMIEAMEADDPPTHLLLMDDDILLDPRIVARAAAFAANAAADVVVGGQAIELERPARLQEAWGRLGDNWLPRMEGSHLDLTAPGALQFWDQCPDVHYNGWWFSMIPMRAIRACGLPTPIFLRGDDIEYGLRLRAAGVPTVPLPGLGVWHASVRYKHVGMVQYYDLRNGLITAATHPELAPPPGTMQVLGWAMHHLLVHRYRAAAASLMALADFLAGPDVALRPNGAVRHRRLADAIKVLPAPDRRQLHDSAGLRQPAAYDVSDSRPMTALSALVLLLRILLRPASRRIAVLQIGAPDPLAIRGEGYFLALEPQGKRCLVMVPRKLLLMRLLTRALWLSLRYGLTRRKAAMTWRERLPALRDRAHWAREFGQAGD